MKTGAEALLLAALFAACFQALPVEAITAGTELRVRGLETGPAGEQNVLLVFGRMAGSTTYLVRACQAGGAVIAYELLCKEADRAVSRSLFPHSFLLDDSLSKLVGWVGFNLRVPVSHAAVVRERCWPSRVGSARFEPLLDMASFFPGRLTATFPQAAPVCADSLARSLLYDPSYSLSEVLRLLGEIESARSQARLTMLKYGGGPSAAELESACPGFHWRRHKSVNFRSFAPAAARLERPRPFLVVPNAENLRGMLPPALPARVVERGNPAINRVAITIDDGWNADPGILDTLKSWRVPFTAFIIGEFAAGPGSGFVRRIYQAGGEVCSHTHTHRLMRLITRQQFQDELYLSEAAICGITHQLYPYIRFFSGEYDANVLAWSSMEGFWVVNWTIDSHDTDRSMDTDGRLKYILSSLEPGAIILFHFGGFGTRELLARLIPEIKKRGFEPTSLTGVLEGTPFRVQN